MTWAILWHVLFHWSHLQNRAWLFDPVLLPFGTTLKKPTFRCHAIVFSSSYVSQFFGCKTAGLSIIIWMYLTKKVRGCWCALSYDNRCVSYANCVSCGRCIDTVLQFLVAILSDFATLWPAVALMLKLRLRVTVVAALSCWDWITSAVSHMKS